MRLTRFPISGAALVACLNAALPAQAVSFTTTPDANIPDGNPAGLASNLVVAGLASHIASLRVDLDIIGRNGTAWNGDLYATLVHNSGYAILLNRPGRTGSDPIGYGDNGLTIRLDEAAAGDVHSYRASLPGGERTPLPGLLTGSWKPDGRAVDPDLVTSADARSATFASFIGLDPNGTWTLFLADMELGNQAKLSRWSIDLELKTTEIPDSGLLGLGHLALLAFLAARRSHASPRH